MNRALDVAGASLGLALASPVLAAATRQQLSQLQSLVKPRGAVQSLSFKGVGPAGADIYHVSDQYAVHCHRVNDDAVTGF